MISDALTAKIIASVGRRARTYSLSPIERVSFDELQQARQAASSSSHAVFAELVFWAIVVGLRPQKYEGGKSASGAH